MHFEILLAFCFSSIILTLSPGPDILYVLTQSITEGKKRAVMVSVGLTTGLIIHTILVVSGLSFLISENNLIFNFLKFFGAGYFFYLSIQTFLRRKRSDLVPSSNKTQNYFKKGLVMNLLNPKVSLFFIALLPGFKFHDHMNVEIQFLILGLIFWVQATIIFILVSIFSSKLKFMDSKNEITSKKYLLEILIYLFVAFWILKP